MMKKSTLLLYLHICIFIKYALATSFKGDHFRYDYAYRHKGSGEIMQMRGQGIHKTVHYLDQNPFIKRILCIGSKVLVAVNESKSFQSWQKGDILIGSAKWGCHIHTDVENKPGIFAKIELIKIPNKARLELKAVGANLLDVFEEADILYNHVPGDWSNFTTEHRRRFRRGIIDWAYAKVTKLILPFDYNATIGNTDFGFNYNGNDGVGTMTASIIDKKENIEFETNSTWMKSMSNSTTGTKIEAKVTTKVQCEQCYTKIEAGLTFTLKIEMDSKNKPVFKQFGIEFSGSVKVNIDLLFEITGQFSYDKEKMLWESKEKPFLHIPLVPTIALFLDISYHVDLWMKVKFEAMASLTIRNVGFDISSSCKFGYKMKSGEAGKIINEFVPPTLTIHEPTVTAKGQTSGSFSIYPNLYVHTGISWGFKDLLSVNLKAPIKLSLVPEISYATEAKLTIGGALVTDFEVNGAVNFQIQLMGLDLGFILIGHHWKLPTINLSLKPYSTQLISEQLYKKKFTLCLNKMNNHNSINVCKTTKRKKRQAVARDGFQISASMSSKLDQLEEILKKTYDKSDTIQLESVQPNGQVAVIKPKSSSGITVAQLEYMARCINFPYVGTPTNGKIQVCSKAHDDSEVVIAEKYMSIAGSYPLNQCNSLRLPTIAVQKSHPENLQPHDICGPPVTKISRLDEDAFSTLYQYSFGDVEFENEERLDTWCGTNKRTCIDCRLTSTIRGNDPEDWCSDRVMTFRLAYRLRRLASLVQQKWPNNKLKLLEAWDEPTSTYPNGKHASESLHYEGRAAQVTLSSTPSTQMLGDLSSLAVCAGFDYVKNSALDGYVELYVKLQSDIIGTMVSFIDSKLMKVNVPTSLQEEYEYPKELEHETRKSLLFDGYKQSTKLTEHFTVKEFLSPNKRFFRLDKELVLCLEQTRVDLNQAIIVISGSGYRVKSHNNENFALRHTEEKHRFQAGQAVEIKLTKGHHLSLLAEQIIKSCIPLFIYEKMTLGIGAHKDRLYVDIRPRSEDNLFLETWNNGNDKLFEDLSKWKAQVNAGTPLIDPSNKNTACKDPMLGKDLYYLNIQVDGTRSDCETTSPFCAESKRYRQKATNEFIESLSKLFGQKVPSRDINSCFVNNCGHCHGSGSIWKNKVTACSSWIKSYIKTVSNPFGDLEDKAAFFNAETQTSSVHDLACNDQKKCPENTQLYSLILKLITQTFRPDINKEKRIISAAENPNPALDIVEQEVAMNAKGHVYIYIEKNNDISALNSVLKILMVYNKDVKNVTFYVAPTGSVGRLNDAIQRKSDYWSSGACPDRSRLAIAPFNIKEIPEHRAKRSLENSKNRNDMRHELHNWEMKWIIQD